MLERRTTLALALSVVLVGCGSDHSSSDADHGRAIQFVASPATVAVGENTWLSWTGQNVVACQASGGWSGDKPPSGGFRTPPLTVTTTYSLQCAGARSGSIARVTVYVEGGASGGAPQVSLRSQYGSVPANGSTILQWSAPNSKNCAASGSWSGAKANQGSQQIKGLMANSTFTLTCDGPEGTGIAMTEVVLQRATLRWAGAGDSASQTGGFQLFWGTRSGQPENVVTIADPTLRERMIDLPGAGTYYFILATLDANKKEIGRSNQASKAIPF